MIDVAVPVYGNEPLVRRCLESVFAHTPEPHRLLVIDDASPDPGLRRALEDLDEEGKILLFRNPENRGFVSTVNRAFRMTANDVVALNSDTVVTPGWLGKMAPMCCFPSPGRERHSAHQQRDHLRRAPLERTESDSRRALTQRVGGPH